MLARLSIIVPAMGHYQVIPLSTVVGARGSGWGAYYLEHGYVTFAVTGAWDVVRRTRQGKLAAAFSVAPHNPPGRLPTVVGARN